LLEKLEAGVVSPSAPPEAGLQYPGSSLVVSSNEARLGTAAGSRDFRDVRKTTFATEATGDQVIAWYQDWLVAHGWQLASSSDAAVPASRQYARGAEHFRLALGDPATIRDIPAISSGRACRPSGILRLTSSSIVGVYSASCIGVRT